MSTTMLPKTRNKTPDKVKKIGLSTVPEIIAAPCQDVPGNFVSLLIDETKIDFSPRNYRTTFDETKIGELAAQMKALGYVIEAVTVRVVVDGRYELVVGERRVRAARIAGIKFIPATVRVLTDDEVDEIQWAENHQREDPHPMLEARRMAAMLAAKKSVEEVAGRVGRSVTYVYGRVKLANLTPEFQDLCLRDTLQVKDALLIATLSKESQALLYEEHGKAWVGSVRVNNYNLPYLVSRYKCTLSRAAFDPAKKDLLPDVGACSKCPFNSATKNNQSLFPDDNKEGYCSNMQCFDRKTWAGMCLSVGTGIIEHKATALIFDGDPSEAMTADLPKIPGAAGLPTYDIAQVTRVTEPSKPAHKPARDPAAKKAWQAVVAGYKSDAKVFSERLTEGKIVRGLYIHDFKVFSIFFLPEPPKPAKPLLDADHLTAAQVNDVIKADMATPEIVTKELGRMKQREGTNRERDKELIAKEIYRQLTEQVAANMKTGSFTLTPADKVAALWLIMNVLSYKTMPIASTYLFGKSSGGPKELPLSERLKKLNDKSIAFLIRYALLGYEPCKNPNSAAYTILVAVAQGAGINIKKIESQQTAAAKKRQDKQKITETKLRRTLASLQKRGTKKSAARVAS